MTLKNTRGKCQNPANKSWLRAADFLAKYQGCHILIPHCTNLNNLAGSSPSFHRSQYFGLISDIVLTSSLRRSPVLTVLPTWDTTFSQVWLIPSSNLIPPPHLPHSISVQSRSSGLVYAYGEPGGKAFFHGHIPDSSLLWATSFSW